MDGEADGGLDHLLCNLGPIADVGPTVGYQLIINKNPRKVLIMKIKKVLI